MTAGLVFASLSEDARAGSLVGLASEDDLAGSLSAGKSSDLVRWGQALSDHVLAERPASVKECLAQSWQGGVRVAEVIELVSEKERAAISLKSVGCLESSRGKVQAYVHHNWRVGALFSFVTPAQTPPGPSAQRFLKVLGMHVAAQRPLALRREELDLNLVERKVAIYHEEVMGEPLEQQSRLVESKLNQFFRRNVLLEQAWIQDEAKSVAEAMAEALGADAELEGFLQARPAS